MNLIDTAIGLNVLLIMLCAFFDPHHRRNLPNFCCVSSAHLKIFGDNMITKVTFVVAITMPSDEDVTKTSRGGLLKPPLFLVR